jgi:uncharacterized protein (TIGR00297 family)
MPFSQELCCGVRHTPTWLVGLVLAAGIALVAFRARSLTASGAIAAAVVGTIAMGAGWSWGALLVAYFASSSLLSRYREREKAARSAGGVEKGGARDAVQVAANGGAFAIAAAGYWLSPHPAWLAVGAGALAASAADTWATEIGMLAGATPRSILTGRPVSVGSSGGVTIQGWLAAAAGAGFVAAVVFLVQWPRPAVVAAILGGVIGCALDSVIGAAFQARRRCMSCDVLTEQRVHRCGAETQHVGGAAWLDNDGVNALGTAGGALFGIAAARYF